MLDHQALFCTGCTLLNHHVAANRQRAVLLNGPQGIKKFWLIFPGGRRNLTLRVLCSSSSRSDAIRCRISREDSLIHYAFLASCVW